MSEHALVRNASDVKQVKRAGKSQRRRAEDDKSNLLSVLTTYDGRAVLWRVLEFAGPNTQSHRGEATHDTSFQEGKRSVGLWLMAEVCRADLASYHQMQTEAARRDEMIAEPAPKTDEPFPVTEPVEEDDGN